MVFGIVFLVIGYAIFYWGIHHFESTDPQGHPWPRYSLTCLLGLNKLNLPSFQPLQYDVPAMNPQANTTTPTPSSTTPTGQLGKAPQNWQRDILSGLGAPVSQNNIYKLTNWNLCEGNANGASGLPINNPFNTTLNGYGGTSVNSAGVKSYPDWSSGVQATVSTIQESRWQAINTNLVKDGLLQDFVYAFATPGWTSEQCLAGRLLNSGAANPEG